MQTERPRVQLFPHLVRSVGPVRLTAEHRADAVQCSVEAVFDFPGMVKRVPRLTPHEVAASPALATPRPNSGTSPRTAAPSASSMAVRLSWASFSASLSRLTPRRFEIAAFAVEHVLTMLSRRGRRRAGLCAVLRPVRPWRRGPTLASSLRGSSAATHALAEPAARCRPLVPRRARPCLSPRRRAAVRRSSARRWRSAA